MYILILLFKWSLKFVYFFLKWLPTNPKKVVMISRQSDQVTLDFQLLEQEIHRIDEDYKVVMLCHTIRHGVLGAIRYYFLLWRQLYHLATSRVCVVDSYSLAVSIPNHKKSLIVIQIWHAIATVKQFGYQTLKKQYGRNEQLAKWLRMHRNYDWVISGSLAMKNIFAKTFQVEESKVKCIGTPRVDYLLRKEDQIDSEILKQYPHLKDKKVILYAPTFRRDVNIQLDDMTSTIDFEKYHLIVKTHPVKEQQFQETNIYRCPEFSTMQLLSIADYVITDYSAISVEASLMDVPVYFYVYDLEGYKEKNGLNINIEKEMKGLCYQDFHSLYYQLDHEKYDYSRLRKFRDKYVTNQNGNAGYLLANYIVNGIWLEQNKKTNNKRKEVF